MDTKENREIIAEIENMFKEVFDAEENDFVVSSSTEEFYVPHSDAYSEFSNEQYIYYTIKPTNFQTKFKLNLRDDKIKFETKVFEKYDIVFENFDFLMHIVIGNELYEYKSDKNYKSISFCNCNIGLILPIATTNTLILQRISFDKCNIDELQIYKTTFAKEISFYENTIQDVSLSNCIFQKNIYFNHSILQNKIDFHESEFEKVACFYGTTFKKPPNFSACYFKEPRAVNLINVSVDNLDFEQVECYIKNNFKDERYKMEITQNPNKVKEIEQKYKLRYAKNTKDSFRTIKDILIAQNNTLEAQEWHKLELYAKEKEIEIALKSNSKNHSINKDTSNIKMKKIEYNKEKFAIMFSKIRIICLFSLNLFRKYIKLLFYTPFLIMKFIIYAIFTMFYGVYYILFHLLFSNDFFSIVCRFIKYKTIKIKRIGKNLQDYTTWVDCVLLQFYRHTSDHHTNFLKILNFAVGMVALYGFLSCMLIKNIDILISATDIKFIIIFGCVSFIIMFLLQLVSNKKTFVVHSYTIIFVIFGSLFIVCLISNPIQVFPLMCYFLLLIFFYSLFICKIKLIVFIIHTLSYMVFLTVIIFKPQFINPFIGVFSSDKLFESRLEKKLSNLNANAIINLAKISQNDFTLQYTYNIPFTELNAAKKAIIDNKDNLIGLKDKDSNKFKCFLGDTLYSDILQAMNQDEILSDSIKSTSILYSIILLLCIFSLQKTARKNSIVPS